MMTQIHQNKTKTVKKTKTGKTRPTQTNKTKKKQKEKKDQESAGYPAHEDLMSFNPLELSFLQDTSDKENQGPTVTRKPKPRGSFKGQFVKGWDPRRQNGTNKQ